MSASTKDNLLRYKQRATLNDYTILFLADFYEKADLISDFSVDDKAEILALLNVPETYTIPEMIQTMLMNYSTERLMPEATVRMALDFYHETIDTVSGLPYLSDIEYNDFLTLL